MNVYLDGNFWGHKKDEMPLKPVPVCRTLNWEDLEIRVPAVYVGDGGAVLDLCVRVPLDKMKAFLEKWNQKARLSGLSDEALEALERESPASLHFRVEMDMDHMALELKQICSTTWHPLELEEACVSSEAKELMEAYCCDPSSGWVFIRGTYRWKDMAVLRPEKLRLMFREMLSPVTAVHFTTAGDCAGEKVWAVHPVTGRRYEITLLRCETARLNREVFTAIGENMEYPECYQVLTYCVSENMQEDGTQETTLWESGPREAMLPENQRLKGQPPHELFNILDCASGDHPRDRRPDRQPDIARAASSPMSRAASSPMSRAASAIAIIGGASGAAVPNSAAVLNATASSPGADQTLLYQRTAMSALHFEPVTNVEWRVVFQIKRRGDMETELELN